LLKALANAFADHQVVFNEQQAHGKLVGTSGTPE
jgi:hypothetical protein